MGALPPDPRSLALGAKSRRRGRGREASAEGATDAPALGPAGRSRRTPALDALCQGSALPCPLGRQDQGMVQRSPGPARESEPRTGREQGGDDRATFPPRTAYRGGAGRSAGDGEVGSAGATTAGQGQQVTHVAGGVCRRGSGAAQRSWRGACGAGREPSAAEGVGRAGVDHRGADRSPSLASKKSGALEWNEGPREERKADVQADPRPLRLTHVLDALGGRAPGYRRESAASSSQTAPHVPPARRGPSARGERRGTTRDPHRGAGFSVVRVPEDRLDRSSSRGADPPTQGRSGDEG